MTWIITVDVERKIEWKYMDMFCVCRDKRAGEQQCWSNGGMCAPRGTWQDCRGDSMARQNMDQNNVVVLILVIGK